MKIEWSHIFSASIGYLLVIIVRWFVDFNMGPFFVKRLFWVPTRTFFRANHYDVSGTWEHEWHFPNAASSHTNPLERKSLLVVKQFGNFVYGEFSSASINYALFGKIKEGNFIIGDWYDPKDKLGYYGIFQLRIIDKSTIEGKWMGHSKKTTVINTDKWEWSRAEQI
jgi:hypothetical protein